MDSLNKEFKTGQYEYLIQQGYSYFILKHKAYVNKPGTSLVVAEKTTPVVKDHVVVDQVNSKEHFINYLSYWPVRTSARLETKNYFLNFFFSKTPKGRKEIFSCINRFIDNFDLTEYYSDFIQYGKGMEIKEFIKYFSSSFPISIWKANKVDLELMHKEITKIYSHNESHKFWLIFLRARKSQIKDVKFAPIVSSFLIEKFGDDPKKINAFYPFFPFLRAQLEYIEPDIFDTENEFATIIPLNLKKMSDVFGLIGFSKETYMNHLLLLSQSMAEFYDIEYNECTYESKQRGNVHMNFYHNNPKFTTSIAKKTIIDYFTHLKSNMIEPSTEYIIKWLEYYEMGKLLKEKEEQGFNRNKINKI